ATASAKNTLLLNFLAADTATSIGKKKNGASPIVFKILNVELSSDNIPVILKSIANNLIIDPPMMAGINGDIVPMIASKILMPICLNVNFFFSTGSLLLAPPLTPNFINSVYVFETL